MALLKPPVRLQRGAHARSYDDRHLREEHPPRARWELFSTRTISAPQESPKTWTAEQVIRLVAGAAATGCAAIGIYALQELSTSRFLIEPIPIGLGARRASR